MARVGTMKAATAVMLLLAVVIATAAAMSPPDAVDDLPAAAATAGGTAGTFLPNGNHRSSTDNDGNGQNSPLTELALCVSTCGSNVANCIMTKCYEPLARGKGNPVMVPLCLLACTTDVMSCATSCPNDFAH